MRGNFGGSKSEVLCLQTSQAGKRLHTSFAAGIVYSSTASMMSRRCRINTPDCTECRPDLGCKILLGSILDTDFGAEPPVLLDNQCTWQDCRHTSYTGFRSPCILCFHRGTDRFHMTPRSLPLQDHHDILSKELFRLGK